MVYRLPLAKQSSEQQCLLIVQEQECPNSNDTRTTGYSNDTYKDNSVL